MRDLLRSLPVFAGVVRDFDVADVPDDPEALFAAWLRDAVEHGAAEPHAMTLSTVDADGSPDARVLILKDLDDGGWWFATSATSAKGRQLADCPVAALTFYWPEVGRQVRVRGPVVEGSAERGAADFRSRGSAARAVALASRESQPLADRAACEEAVAAARQWLSADPTLVAEGWRVYAVAARSVEFWQADKDRQHARVRYAREADGWSRALLWP
ncbi:pyridoxine/pyridoxamine 5'-phosphate oxidase [Segniliparus rugosus]|uniref:Pyridoxamine 5'-phosphate oxidase n=1 Tax=Segniliparus rugosus (strain ATCC BAA-974 / DSM 45345 / CCUG 50838 / CIP 108380 / JCM 13579 / CDC 945) TaxID=679197 RepID=E5XPB1_SEGRC|nr:pyridoxal 5'-phosphate synthase [Segniliparus rugosus]EFV13820.2 pyridoxamine 5'-phosphate oxidase [Segniliparus rugosus ATCC BAA-974]